MLKRLPLLTERSLSDVRSTQIEISKELHDGILAKGTFISCKKGCNHCCSHPVAASLFEGVLIYQALKRARRWTKALQAEIDRVAKMTVGLPPETWMVAQIQCPLLKDGLCIAYKSRPFQCRTTWSSGDPDLCHPHRFSRQTPIVPRLSELVRFQEVENALMKRQGLKYRTLPLTLALQLGERIATQQIELDNVEAEVLKEFLQAWA